MIYLNYDEEDKFCRYCGHELKDIPGKESYNSQTGVKEVTYITRSCPVKITRKLLLWTWEEPTCPEKSPSSDY